MGLILKTIRYLSVLALGASSGIFGFLFCLLRPFHRNNSYYIGRALSHSSLWISGIKVRLTDKHHWQAQQPCIFISNHQHNLDILINAYVMPKGTVSLGKKSLVWLPFFGQMYWLAGNILIDRSNPQKAKSTMENTVNEINGNKKSIWIMPEGTRNSTPGELLPFKKGAFHLAIAAKVPIVPIAISTFQNRLDFGKLHAGTVHMKVLPPIQTKSLCTDDAAKLTEQCRELIMAGIKELDSQPL